jgi:hypothetical protein
VTPPLTAEFLAWHAAFNFDRGAGYMAAQVLAVNDQVRALAREVWKSPTYALLEAQRQLTHEPCRLLSCHGRCSRCIHAEAWRKRGHRPYSGQEPW